MTQASPLHHPRNDTEPNQSHDEQRDQQEAEEKSAPGPHIVYEAILLEGEEELERSTSALFWSGLAAGLSMGFSLVVQGLLRSHLNPDAHWLPLIAKLGYPVGFLIVILGRQQLFTENTLTPILPLLKRRTAHCFANVGRLWAVVLVANVIGALCFALAAAKTDVFEPAVKSTFLAIGHEALAHSFLNTFLRAIFAGWLIALMVWLLPAAETARVWVIIIVTYVVGLAGFSHVIAGSVDALYVLLHGEISLEKFLFGWFTPTLLGNILGGTALVAALNHAQVTSGEEE
jgi:formate/nitrite transporter FocA (FNT family)